MAINALLLNQQAPEEQWPVSLDTLPIVGQAIELEDKHHEVSRHFYVSYLKHHLAKREDWRSAGHSVIVYLIPRESKEEKKETIS